MALPLPARAPFLFLRHRSSAPAAASFRILARRLLAPGSLTAGFFSAGFLSAGFLSAGFLSAGLLATGSFAPELAAQTPTTAVATASGTGAAGGFEDPEASDLRRTVERFAQDRSVLMRRYSLGSPTRRARMAAFHAEWGALLDAMDYDALNTEGKIDWVLLRDRIRYEAGRLEVEAAQEAELEILLPFQQKIVTLHEARRDLLPVAPREAAETVHQVTREMEVARDRIRAALQGDRKVTTTGGAAAGGEGATAGADTLEVTPVIALRAVSRIGELQQAGTQWFDHFDGYDPMFSWWVRAPWERFGEVATELVTLLRQEGAGIRPGQPEPTVGDPLGREALLLDIRNEMMPYTPEELLELAERELAWGEAELRAASRELGYGEDWQAAVEYVKSLHVEPGEQIHLVTELAREAEAFLEARDLVTVPELAREVWRMEMLSPARQRIAPFFLGGETVQVAFPTDAMSHEEKLMSLRSNNPHFSRAVVHHELIPGHHLQGFMTSRYSTHRSLFSTPFWGEGWALYWELLLWDLDFARSPEDRIGMLVWRNHRAARILFSLAFHLEQMTPEEAVELLVTRVGFERSASEAEVRRSFTGQYSPLYQAGYLLGGLQLRQLHREMVESGQMSNRAFHDHVLKSGRMPIEMVRASVTGEAPPRDFTPTWRFYSLDR